jgi:hypothetical protein
MIVGKEVVRAGEAKNSWLTGMVAWSFVAFSQYLLEVRPDYAALVVDPQIGLDVPSVTVTRAARGATYVVRVTNSGIPGLAGGLSWTVTRSTASWCPTHQREQMCGSRPPRPPVRCGNAATGHVPPC